MSDNAPQQEMNLEQFVYTLPTSHLARRQFERLRQVDRAFLDGTPHAINEWASYINDWAESKGWNEGERAIGDTFMLFVTEIAEAYEDFRNGRGNNEIYFELRNGVSCNDSDAGRKAFEEDGAKPCGIPIEIADLAIRVLHFIAQEGIDLQAMVEMKMAYNQKRPYRHGGKKT